MLHEVLSPSRCLRSHTNSTRRSVQSMRIAVVASGRIARACSVHEDVQAVASRAQTRAWAAQHT